MKIQINKHFKSEEQKSSGCNSRMKGEQALMNSEQLTMKSCESFTFLFLDLPKTLLTLSKTFTGVVNGVFATLLFSDFFQFIFSDSSHSIGSDHCIHDFIRSTVDSLVMYALCRNASFYRHFHQLASVDVSYANI